MDSAMNGGKKGLYLGTEIIGKKWWKRYLKDKLFARGNGKYWFDDNGFSFLRYLTSTPIYIPFSEVIEIQLGTKHVGRWAMGNLIVKILWRKDDLVLSSGFLYQRIKKMLPYLKLNWKGEYRREDSSHEDRYFFLDPGERSERSFSFLIGHSRIPDHFSTSPANYARGQWCPVIEHII